MSLYAFGKIVGPAEVLEQIEECVEEAGAAFLREVDADDATVLDELVPGHGAVFAITDHVKELDATGLWADATTAAVRWHSARSSIPVHELIGPTEEYFDALSRTALARICRCLVSLRGVEIIGIAFVDGGIEALWPGSAEECYREMAWEWRLPWDQSSNRLYIWSPKARDSGYIGTADAQ